MNQDLFQTLLATLRPQTLAQIAVDLEDALEDWQFYPEEAPPADVRQALQQALSFAVETGTAKAQAQKIDFQQLLEQLREARDAEDWSQERARQERQNWFKDYK